MNFERKIKSTLIFIMVCFTLCFAFFYLSLYDVKSKSNEVYGKSLGPISLTFNKIQFLSTDYRYSYFLRLQWKMEFHNVILFMPGDIAYWYLFPFREVEFSDHED